MSKAASSLSLAKPVHPFLRPLGVAAALPEDSGSLATQVAAGILDAFRRLGHRVTARPDDATDLLLTTAPFGRPLGWREALLFSVRRRFSLQRAPTIYTVIEAPRTALDALLGRLERALQKDEPDPGDYAFEGMAPKAYHVLYEQGRRGGPILSLMRLLQAQAKCIRLLLAVGERRLEGVYYFDLVGAHPYTPAGDLEACYTEVALRLATAESTREVTEHLFLYDQPVPADVWQRSAAHHAVVAAARQLGRRRFFTEMIRISDLVQVPAVAESVARQYSEGCFGTWDPELQALVATITGSARPVDKANIGEEDLAVIAGVRPDGMGALVRPIEGLEPMPPSSEAVEMYDMDRDLPTVEIDTPSGRRRVPVARSKLHGHRGVRAYDPTVVEYVPMDAAYQHYLVSCGSDAQARGIRRAFSRSEALLNPSDPRQATFTVLPGHGSVIVEKWVPGAAPLETLWRYMDTGRIEIENRIPQGPLAYAPQADGRMVLTAESYG